MHTHDAYTQTYSLGLPILMTARRHCISGRIGQCTLCDVQKADDELLLGAHDGLDFAEHRLAQLHEAYITRWTGVSLTRT